jgi:hypothetical protein
MMIFQAIVPSNRAPPPPPVPAPIVLFVSLSIVFYFVAVVAADAAVVSGIVSALLLAFDKFALEHFRLLPPLRYNTQLNAVAAAAVLIVWHGFVAKLPPIYPDPCRLTSSIQREFEIAVWRLVRKRMR